MTEKGTDSFPTWKKLLDHFVNFFVPAMERRMRKWAPYVADSALFQNFRATLDPATLETLRTAGPGTWSMIVGAIPDAMFLTPGIADFIRGGTTRWLEEFMAHFAGDGEMTKERAVEAEAKADAAAAAVEEQMVKFDKLTNRFFHFSDCPVVNAEFLPRGAKHHEMGWKAALDANYEPAACCVGRFRAKKAEATAEAAATAGTAAAKKPGFTKLPEGASVMDVLGALLRDESTRQIGERLIAWMELLSREDFVKAEQLMTEAFDTVEEATALDEIDDAKKIDFLTAMKSRKQEKKSKIEEARKGLTESGRKAVDFIVRQLHALDEKVVSDALIASERAKVDALKNPKWSFMGVSLRDIFIGF